MNGIVILDKPGGISSNQAQARLKRLLGQDKMGFLGTLDPLATGVLPVFVGKATKLIAAFEGAEKSYRVTIRLGQRTDTLDSEGKLLEERPLDGIDAERVRAAILSFAGGYRQRVPEYAAVKIGGVPAYRLARRGEPVPERERDVKLWDLAVESVELPHAVFRADCSAGTYMRSLASDIGTVLGVGAHVAALRRLRCGPLFTLENSITLAEIEERTANGDFAMVRNPAEFLTGHFPLTVGEDSERFLREGRAIPLNAAVDRQQARIGAPAKALRPGGTLVAVGEIVSGGPDALSFHPSKVLI